MPFQRIVYIALIAVYVVLFSGLAMAQVDLNRLPDCGFAALGDDVEGLQVGAVVFNLDTQRGCQENLNSTFHVASIDKIFIAGAFLEQVANGDASFDQLMIFSERYLMDDRSACLQQNDVGRSFTLGYLSDIMISCSDNSATWMLMDWIGRDVVQDYINRLGIVGIGEVLPYGEVDRLKLATVDERWEAVPASLAAQFYRRRRTDGLAWYFDEIPEYDPEMIREANIRYLEAYDYNTATPRAIAEYMIRLWNDLINGDETQQQIAWWMMNTLLLTQRQFSSQAIPGTFYVGTKNGSDYGVTAELSVIHDTFQDRIPMAISVIFTQQQDLTVEDVQTPFRSGGVLEDYLLELSPYIRDKIFPYGTSPQFATNSPISVSVVNSREMVRECWQDFDNAGRQESAVFPLEACWGEIPTVIDFSQDDWLGVGLTLRGLGEDDSRMTFIYRSPDDVQYSYQEQQFNADVTAFYSFHRADVPGIWEIEAYRNLERIFSHLLIVELADSQ